MPNSTLVSIFAQKCPKISFLEITTFWTVWSALEPKNLKGTGTWLVKFSALETKVSLNKGRLPRIRLSDLHRNGRLKVLRATFLKVSKNHFSSFKIKLAQPTFASKIVTFIEEFFFDFWRDSARVKPYIRLMFRYTEARCNFGWNIKSYCCSLW